MVPGLPINSPADCTGDNVAPAGLDRRNSLLREIRALRERQENRRRAMARFHTLLVLPGTAFIAGAAISGFLGMGTLAGATAVLAGIPLSLEKLFGYGEKRNFNEIVVNECYNLRFALNYSADTEKQVEVIRQRFQCLATACTRKWPSGKGMEAVRQLYEMMDSKGIVNTALDKVEEKRV